MSASSAFARSLPAVKLTAHDPRLTQVLTTPRAYLSRGDFGFKSPLGPALDAARHHKDGVVRYIQVTDQDSISARGLSWKEREGEVLLLKRWSETHTRVQRMERSRDAISVFTPAERTPQPLPHSRFDRASRHVLPDARQPADTKLDQPGSLQSVPNYLVLPEERFEKLLDWIRTNREAYKEARVLQRALDRRSAKFDAAQRRYKTLLDESEYAAAAGGQTPLPAPPKKEDFSLEAELQAIRSVDPASEADDVELDPVDMYNLARSTHNYYLSRLHDLGGLQYSQPDEIVSQTLSPALPGRVLSQIERQNWLKSPGKTFNKDYTISLGSRVATFRVSRAGRMQVVSLDRTRKRPEQGVGLFRFDSDPKLNLTNPYLDTLRARRMYGAGVEGAWSDDLQQLGLGYIVADARAACDSTGASFMDRVRKLGEDTARAESVPGSRNWVGSRQESIEWSGPRIKVNNPLGDKYKPKFSLDGPSTYHRKGPGGIFSSYPGPGGDPRNDGSVRLNRDGYKRPGLGLENDAGETEEVGAGEKQRPSNINDILFGN